MDSRKLIRDILKEKTHSGVTITNKLIIVNPFDTPPKNCAKRKKEEKKSINQSNFTYLHSWIDCLLLKFCVILILKMFH